MIRRLLARIVSGAWRAARCAPAPSPALVLALAGLVALAGDRPLELTDLMKFRTIRGPVISEDGAWIAYGLWPDRGDGAAVVRSTSGGAEYVIERGSGPVISADGRWVAAKIEPPLAEQEKREREKESGGKKSSSKSSGEKPGEEKSAPKSGGEKPGEEKSASKSSGEKPGGAKSASKSGGEKPGGEKSASKSSATTPASKETGESAGNDSDDELHPGLALLSTADGTRVDYERVASFAFSGDGRFLAVLHVKEKDEEDGDAAEAEEPPGTGSPEHPAAEAVSGGERAAGEAAPGGEPGEQQAASTEPSKRPAETVPSSHETAGQTGKRTEPGSEPGERAAAEAPSGSEAGGRAAGTATSGSKPGEHSGEKAPSGVEQPSETEEQAAEEDGAGTSDDNVGAPLILRGLLDGSEIEIAHVVDFAFSEEGEFLAYSVGVEGGADNGLFVRALREEGLPERKAHAVARGRYTAFAWPRDVPRLAFVAAVDDDEGEPGDAAVWIWDGEPREVVPPDGAPQGWFVPSVNDLAFSKDGERLFLGLKPVDEKLDDDVDAPAGDAPAENSEGETSAGTEAATQAEGSAPAVAAGEQSASEEPPFDPYDVDALLERRGLDVWHWDDPRIVPNQKKRWDREKDRTYRAVVHVGTDRLVPLADRTMRHIDDVDNPRATLGYADVPYLKRITWDGQYRDVYRVSLEDGSRQLVARGLRAGNSRPPVSLSPGGRFVAYYDSPHWYLFDGEAETYRSTQGETAIEDPEHAGRRPGLGAAVDTGAARAGSSGVLNEPKQRLEGDPEAANRTRNLTASLDVPFSNEDHDYPAPAPGYGVGGWIEDDAAVLIYDKYDIWQFPTDSASSPLSVTAGAGREREYVFRAIDLDEERDFIGTQERLLLSAYHDREKHRGFFEARAGASGVEKLVEEPKLYSFVARAKESDRLLYTRESYGEFPDLWVAGLDLRGRRRLSDANPQIDEFAWGEAQLVEWTSDDGIPLEGVLIKPGGYEPGRRYPVLVYFYRLFSDRLHEFNEPVVNHRPSFPHYASHGYAVFLPDVRFEVGQPGFSATKSLVPGVKKLIEMGVADPDAIGLHGHSWSGYQAAFVITQTDLFAAAVAGAPVSNMTSAYSGIRLGTGLARQFQYEQSQSRIGKSLWEGRELYIENSPVFFADRIDTPLLIQFGDEDEAVPWQQGIELYLALRRLGKPVIFLQYRGEPHHLKRYPNKLDYSIKMREFFDHHLKGAPAPAWMTEGVPYRGE